MKHFASLDMFFDFSEWHYRMGRPIANEGFLKALLAYSNFEKFSFFCPDVQHKQKFSEKLKEFIADQNLSNRIKILLQTDLAWSVQTDRYSVFHLGDFTSFMPYLIDVRNRYAQQPFVVTGITHSLDGVFMNLRYLELLLAGLKEYDGIVCSSTAAKNAVEKGMAFVQRRLHDLSMKDSTVPVQLRKIPLGIDDRFFTAQDKMAARQFLNIPQHLTVGLSVGRLSVRQKTDWSPLLELFASMHVEEKLENTIFIIAGGGDQPEISLLDSMIKRFGLEQKVILFPNFPAEVKTKLYAAADFYFSVVDNFQETFGLNVIEAKACGLPVIASDFSGYRELVHDGEDGFLIPTYWTEDIPDFIDQNIGVLNPSLAKMHLSQTIAVDLEALRDAILMLTTNQDKRLELGEQAKKDAQNFRWQNIIKQYEDFWTELNIATEAAKPAAIFSSPGLLTGNFIQTFSHYPARKLRKTDLLAITGQGRRVLNGEFEPIKYEEIANQLDDDLQQFILQKLSVCSQPVSGVLRIISSKFQTPEGRVVFQLLWMLKHGLISVQKH